MDLFSHSGFSINRHFQRSIRIDNEISKEFLEHFIFHDTGKKTLNQIANSFINTNQSGFTLTGPYGTGKSSLALFLQALVNDNTKIKKLAINKSKFNSKGHFAKLFLSKKKWFVLKIVGSKTDLIEAFAENINENIRLTKFLVDEYLSMSELEKSCDVFSKINEIINDDYLAKFNIYCLINNNEREVAQLQFDLKKELGFEDNFFEKKFNYLMEYDVVVDQEISEKSILDFHLSHRTNPEFKFEPNESTSKYIWRYLSNSNLLDNIENVDLEDQNKIILIEKATHERNYTEKKLYDLYKRFLFNINQLLSVQQSYKLLSNVEARALLYQGILINGEAETKLELIKILKDSFIKEGIENAFKDELIKILKEINIEYNKEYYTDNDLKPTEQLFFSLTIVPLGSYESKNIIPK